MTAETSAETSRETEEFLHSPVYSPPELVKRHRYWDKVQQIKSHVFWSASAGQYGCCECGESFPDIEQWAEHLANVLFPYSGEYHHE